MKELGEPVARRAWIAWMLRTMAGGMVLGSMSSRPAAALTPGGASRRIVVYKDPDCECCKAWVTHLRNNGFQPEVHDRTDMDAMKDSLGVPVPLRACHTAVAGRFVIEGHVPAADITRLLARAPMKGVVGLAVPGMPVGSPGMDAPGRRTDRYDVLTFGANGHTSVFASHG